MSNEQLFAIVLALVAALYGGVLWEVRKLRQAKHKHAQAIQWCMMALGIVLHQLQIKIDPPKGDE